MCKSVGSRLRPNLLIVLIVLGLVGCTGGNAFAAGSDYIPVTVATVTSTLYSNGSTSMSPGRVAVDKMGNVFYIDHVSPSTVWEIPASSPVVTTTTPTILLTGLGQYNANALFVDSTGTLWIANGNGSGGAMFEIPASNGVPDIAAITGNGGYSSSTGLPVSGITTACGASPTAPCVWSNSSFAGNLSGSYIQVSDIYSDGAGNVYVVDVYDGTSSGGYNRVVRFNTSSPGTGYLIADNLKLNTNAQVTVAGDGNVYYIDSAAYYSSPTGVTYLLGAASSTTPNTPSAVGTTASLGSSVQVSVATGITTDPWGNLIISGAEQISEVPLEDGSLNFADEFALVNSSGQSSTNFPIADSANNINFGGAVDIHGNYYYASSTNIMQVQVGGYNFGKLAVGTLTTSPDIDLYSNVASCNWYYGFPTDTTGTLSASTYGLLQSFPYGGGKNFFSGCSAISGSNYVTMSFQPVHPGLLRGAFAPQYNINSNNPPWVVANLQGVGIGPSTMLLPGTASIAIAEPQVYASPAHSTGSMVAGFAPAGVALDTYGDIFVADSTNGTVDVDCLATTASATAAVTANPNSGIYCQGYAGYSFQLGATFSRPTAVALDGTNSVYVLDSGSDGNPVTLLQNNFMDPLVIVPNGTLVAGAAFSSPQGLAIDGYGNLYIADTSNNRIIQAHQYGATYSQNGGATYAQNIVYVSSSTTFGGIPLSGPTGLAVDAAGDLFIADTGNNRIVEYSVTGAASVVSVSGITLQSPTSVAVQPSGALVVGDANSIVSLINGGVGVALTFHTSTGALLTPGTPAGINLDLSGNIYVADPANSQVVELNVNTPATIPTYPDTMVGATSADQNLYVYNIGTSALNFSAEPSLSDTTDFGIDSGSTTCTTSSPVSEGSDCALAVYFQPQSAGILSAIATLTDNQPAVSGVSSVTYGHAGVFAASSSQTALFSSSFTAQTIAFVNPGAQTVGTPLTLTPTTSSAGLAVSFVSSTTDVCTVSGTTATFIDSGTCTITASQDGNSTYGPVSVAQSFTVNPEPQVITFANPGPQLYSNGMTMSLVASTSAEDLTVTLSSSTTSVCTVSGTTASILGTGLCTITASQAGNSAYAAATPVIQTFAISNPAPVITGISTGYVGWGAPTFTFTINGSGFVGSTLSESTAPTSTVYWGSSALTTTYVSPTQLTAVVHVFNTDQAGIYPITVQSPLPGGGTSNAMQFEVDSEFAAPAPPSFSTPTASVAPGSAAKYPVTLPSTATGVAAACLNLPSGATCSYSLSAKTVTIATSASTPAGTYQIVVVFTETIPGAVSMSAFVLLPFLLAPIFFLKKRLQAKGVLYTACFGLILIIGTAFFSGCGGGQNTSTTHQVTSSGVVTLTVQ